MNKQGKGKIEYLDYTFNPVTGCNHPCKDKYCYAAKIAKRFGGHYSDLAEGNISTSVWKDGEKIHVLDEPMYRYDDDGKMRKAAYPYGFEPTFHRYRLDEPEKVKKPSIIGVVYMGDLFGEWVPDEWIQEVFTTCEAAPWHKYMFLTKNFLKASNYRYPNNWWIGRTITNKEDSSKLCNGDPWNIDGTHRANHFISIEPLLGDAEYLKYYLYSFKWVIIGQQTNPNKPPEPQWVQSIIDQCRAANVPVFVKSPLYEQFPIQEWPEGLR
jgi:protein gp37